MFLNYYLGVLNERLPPEMWEIVEYYYKRYYLQHILQFPKLIDIEYYDGLWRKYQNAAHRNDSGSEPHVTLRYYTNGGSTIWILKYNRHYPHVERINGIYYYGCHYALVRVFIPKVVTE